MKPIINANRKVSLLINRLPSHPLAAVALAAVIHARHDPTLIDLSFFNNKSPTFISTMLGDLLFLLVRRRSITKKPYFFQSVFVTMLFFQIQAERKLIEIPEILVSSSSLLLYDFWCFGHAHGPGAGKIAAP